MIFSQRLKQAMKELNLTQSQVCSLTGKSKASISQYLSNKQIPPESVQISIATALGLSSDYFTKPDEPINILPHFEVRSGIIEKLDVEDAAKIMQINHNTVRKGLRQGVFPWGYAIHTSENRWVYFINARRFAEIEGVYLEAYKKCTCGAATPTGA